MKRIEYFMANPSGNISCFVLTKTKRDQYKKVARAILKSEKTCEQVAFIKSKDKMEMAGLEFCGNASRVFGLWSFIKQGGGGKGEVIIKVSGSKEPVRVRLDTDTLECDAKMPLPLEVKDLKFETCYPNSIMTAVDQGGIVHFIITEASYDEKDFLKLIKEGYRLFNCEAIGAMYYNKETDTMLPLVHVRDLDTYHQEGSCGSGTVALAAYMAHKGLLPEGEQKLVIHQPGGDLAVKIQMDKGRLIEISLSGKVSIDPIKTLDLDIDGTDSIDAINEKEDTE